MNLTNRAGIKQRGTRTSSASDLYRLPRLQHAARTHAHIDVLALACAIAYANNTRRDDSNASNKHFIIRLGA